VIPETIVGIVVFAAAVGPGYAFVRIVERYGPRRDRSTLEEAAELLVVGSAATGAALLLVLWASTSAPDVGVDRSALADEPVSYILREPGRTLLALAIAVPLSYLLVWAATRAIYHGKAREIQAGGTMWYAAFKQLVPVDHGTLVTVERKDGSAITGLLGSATADNSSRREMLIIAPANRPIYARPNPNAAPIPLQDAFVIVTAEEIQTISGRYLPTAPESGTAAK
jgi:hypothetical protein